MKENKFKIWCKNKNEWEKDISFLCTDGTLVHLDKVSDGDLSNRSIVPYKPETHIPVFYTGLKDKNDKEIWEKDICAFERHTATGIIFDKLEIIFKHGAFGVMSIKGFRPLSSYNLNYVEIIGNSNDSPELLKMGY